MSNVSKEATAALRAAIDANAAILALYEIIGKTIEIDHDKFMQSKEEHATRLKEKLENIIK